MEQHKTGTGQKRSFGDRVRGVTKDWDIKIMSYVMLVVVMVAMIAATVAWFFYMKAAAVSNMGMSTASSDALKVEVKQGETDEGTHFVELIEGEENSVYADLDMPVFENVESYEITVGNADDSQSGADAQTKTVNKMAPGVYGSVTIRLTSLTQQIDHFKINRRTIFEYVDSLTVLKDADTGMPAEDQTDPNVIALEKLAKGHIQFFGKRVSREQEDGTIADAVTIDSETRSVEEYTHNDKYVFCDPIDDDHPLTGELEWDADANEGIADEVTIYWYWPYEYSNLSNSIKEDIGLQTGESDLFAKQTRLYYFDRDKLQEVADGKGSWNEEQLYDYADTRIGSYVEKIRLQLKVEGYHGTETGTTPSE